MARSSPALSTEAEVKNGATTRGREGEKRKQGRKEGKREDGMKKRGREFCATRGRGKGENRARRATEISRRAGKTSGHYVHAPVQLHFSFSLSRREIQSRGSAPREDLERAKIRYFRPRVFHLPKLLCACRTRYTNAG